MEVLSTLCFSISLTRVQELGAASESKADWLNALYAVEYDLRLSQTQKDLVLRLLECYPRT